MGEDIRGPWVGQLEHGRSRLRSRSLTELTRQITPPTKNGHAPPWVWQLRRKFSPSVSLSWGIAVEKEMLPSVSLSWVWQLRRKCSQVCHYHGYGSLGGNAPKCVIIMGMAVEKEMLPSVSLSC